MGRGKSLNDDDLARTDPDNSQTSSVLGNCKASVTVVNPALHFIAILSQKLYTRILKRASLLMLIKPEAESGRPTTSGLRLNRSCLRYRFPCTIPAI